MNHIPVLTGGVGREQLQEFYSKHFIPKMPADTEIIPISRTIGSERLVDELIVRFTHDIEMDWMLPGIAYRSSHRADLWNDRYFYQLLFSPRPRSAFQSL